MKKELLIISFFFLLISLFFFRPLLKGWIAFPGDLLVGEYNPYNTYSFMGYAPAGYPNKGQDFDVIKLLFPAKEFSIRMLKSGEFPLWNPYNFSGNPHLASIQSGTFYPSNVVFFTTFFSAAWSLYILLQPFLAGIFTYFFLRCLTLSKKASTFGGIIFAFSSFMVVWMEYGNLGHTIIWLPLALLLIEKIVRHPTIPYGITFIFVLGFIIFAGHMQLAMYSFLFLLFYIFYQIFIEDSKEKRKKIAIFIALFIGGVLLCAIQLLPSIELFYNSSRSPYSSDFLIKLLIPWFHMVTLFVPDFFGNPATRNYWISGTYIERVSYVGILPLFFILYGLLRKPSKIQWFFIATAITALLLAFDFFFNRILYVLQIPIMATSVPTRVMFLFCFAASALAAMGYHRFEQDKKRNDMHKAIFILGGIYGLLWLFVILSPILFSQAGWVGFLSITKRNLFLPSLLVICSAVLLYFSEYTYVKKYVFFLVIALTVLDLFYFFYKITPFAPPASVYPQTEVISYLKKIQGINRMWGYGSGYIEPNIHTYEKIFSPNGYDALHIKRYGELLTTGKNGQISEEAPRSEADIHPGFGMEDLRNNLYRQQLLNLLGVQYIFHKVTPSLEVKADTATFPLEIYRLIWQKDAWQIYENTQALPRAFLAGQYIVEKDKRKIITAIMSKKVNIHTTIILEENPSQQLQFNHDSKASTVIEKYSPNKVTIKTRSDTNAFLFLSDAYFPGWRAFVDNKETKIYRADYALRAIAVPSGLHTIVFSYYPASFDIGVKISLGTLAILLLLVLYYQLDIGRKKLFGRK